MMIMEVNIISHHHIIIMVKLFYGFVHDQTLRNRTEECQH